MIQVEPVVLSPDPVLTQRDDLTDAAAMHTLLRDTGVIEPTTTLTRGRIRYRPGRRLVVVWHLSDAPAAHGGGGSATIAVESPAHKTSFPGAWHYPAVDATFWRMRDDPALPFLPNLLAGAAPSAELGATALSVAGYSPFDRAIVRGDGEEGAARFFAKVFAGPDAERVVWNHAQIRSAVRVPRVLRVDLASRTIYTEALAGRSLFTMRNGDLRSVAADVGRAVARLHACPPHPAAPMFTRHNLRRMQRLVDAVKSVRPDLAGDLDATADAVQGALDADRALGAPSVTLHGDLTLRNVLADFATGTIAMIDLDTLACGQAAAELCGLIANITVRGCIGDVAHEHGSTIIADLLNGYASVTPLPAEKALRAHASAALLVEVGRAVKSMKQHQLDHLPELLLIARRLAGRATLPW